MKDNLFDYVAKEMSENMGKYDDSQYLSDEDYGLTAEKPIMTKLVDGSNEYLKSLRTVDGKLIGYKRNMSLLINDLMVDKYEITAEGKEICSLYLCMYGTSNSKVAPKGFKLKETEKTKSDNIGKSEFMESSYVPITTSTSTITSNINVNNGFTPQQAKGMLCASANDISIDESEIKVSKLKKKIKILIAICIVLVIALVGGAVGAIVEFNNITAERDELKAEVENLGIYESWARDFYLDNAVIVSENDPEFYHRAGCAELGTKYYYMIKNPEAAKVDHRKCPVCFGMTKEEFVHNNW